MDQLAVTWEVPVHPGPLHRGRGLWSAGDGALRTPSRFPAIPNDAAEAGVHDRGALLPAAPPLGLQLGAGREERQSLTAGRRGCAWKQVLFILL